MVVRIVGGEQVVCDCQGGTPDKYLDKLLVGLIVSKDLGTAPAFCFERISSWKREVTSKLVLRSSLDH